MRSSSKNAPAKPSAGEAIAGIATLWAMSCHSTPFEPDWTSAAPISPPISACDDCDREARRERARRDRRRDGVRRVVEAVREVEPERDDDHDPEQDRVHV